MYCESGSSHFWPRNRVGLGWVVRLGGGVVFSKLVGLADAFEEVGFADQRVGFLVEHASDVLTGMGIHT